MRCSGLSMWHSSDCQLDDVWNALQCRCCRTDYSTSGTVALDVNRVFAPQCQWCGQILLVVLCVLPMYPLHVRVCNAPAACDFLRLQSCALFSTSKAVLVGSPSQRGVWQFLSYILCTRSKRPASRNTATVNVVNLFACRFLLIV